MRRLKYKNVAAELLAKLLGDEIKLRSKRNLVQSHELSAVTAAQQRPGFPVTDAKQWPDFPMLKKTLNAELIKLAKQMSAANQRGMDLGLNDDAIAFYDALATNNSAVEAMGKDELKVIAAAVGAQMITGS